jgi:hypothetical protein
LNDNNKGSNSNLSDNDEDSDSDKGESDIEGTAMAVSSTEDIGDEVPNNEQCHELTMDHLFDLGNSQILDYSAVQNLSSVCNLERDSSVSSSIWHISAYELHP